MALEWSPWGRLSQEGVWLRPHRQSTVQGVIFTREIFIFGYSCSLANISKGFFGFLCPLVQGEQEQPIVPSQCGGCLTCPFQENHHQERCVQQEVGFTPWLCMLSLRLTFPLKGRKKKEKTLLLHFTGKRQTQQEREKASETQSDVLTLITFPLNQKLFLFLSLLLLAH